MSNALTPTNQTAEDVFGEGISRIQDWGEEEEEEVVYHVRLKRNRYHSCESEMAAHLHYETTKVRTVKAGTLKGLVVCLLPVKDSVEPSFLNVFLGTYLTFTTSEDLVDQLILRHSQFQQEGGNNADQASNVHKNLLSFIRLWLDQFSEGFKQPPQFQSLKKLITFIENNVSHDRNLISLAKKVLVEFELEQSPPRMDGPKDDNFGIFSLPPQQFAEHLTYLAAGLFRRVKPHECLRFLSSKQDKEVKAPTVWATVEQFNELTRLVITTVLRASLSNLLDNDGQTPQIRAKVIEQWVIIATHCRRMKNFTSVKAVVSGLEAQPIYRLHKTWSYVSSDHMESFSELQGLMAVDNNFQTSRSLLQREGTAKYIEQGGGEDKKKGRDRHTPGPVLGVVPHLGTFLQDLTYLDAAFPDKTEKGMINFEKRRKYFEAFAQIQLFQKSAANYPATYNPDLAFEAWLTHTPLLSDKESYELSDSLESESDAILPINDVTLSTNDVTLSMNGGSKQTGTIKKRLCSFLHPPKSPVGDRFLQNRSMSDSAGQSTATKEGNPIIKISMNSQDMCNYKSLRLQRTHTTQSVIENALEKYGLEELNHCDFSLYQLLSDKRKVHIPEGSAVFFAMSSSESSYNFILEPNNTRNP
jgi:ral guanine nucleotide dissociation stimulator-like 1